MVFHLQALLLVCIACYQAATPESSGAHPLIGAEAMQDPPAPNTACGTEKEVKIPAGTPISGTGASLAEALEKALAAASGIVCQICEDGIQCKRTFVSSSGSTTSTTQQNPDGTWTVTGTVNSYTVKLKCEGCP